MFTEYRPLGLAGTGRGRAWITPTQTEAGPPDLVKRQCKANRPNQLWVSDFTSVATWRSFVYVAFVIDVFARRIVGWRGSRRCRLTSSSMVETMRAMVAHLERCAACRAEVEGLRRVRRATRSAFDAAVDSAPRREFAAELASRLRTETVRRPVDTMPRRQWLALAARGLLAVGAGWGWRMWSASLSALIHAAVGDHRFCALTFKLAERPIPLDEAARRYGGVNASMSLLRVAGHRDRASSAVVDLQE